MTPLGVEEAAQRKLRLLRLAEELGNVSRACEIVGYSRQQFYEIRRNFELYGVEGLIDQPPGPRGPHPNRVRPEVEKAILEHGLAHPTHGAQRVAEALTPRGIQVSAGGVRGVWSRHGLDTVHARILRLRETARTRKLKLSEEQIRALERLDPELRDRQARGRFPGDLVVADTVFFGTLENATKVHLQLALDSYSRYVWGRLHGARRTLTAARLLVDDVLPFFVEHAIRVRTISTDDGTEYHGRPDRHPYEILLRREGIEHRTHAIGRARPNGFIERFHRTLLDEHVAAGGRTRGDETIGAMQAHLDAWLHGYNRDRPHPGLEGRPPYTAFLEGLPRARAFAP